MGWHGNCVKNMAKYWWKPWNTMVCLVEKWNLPFLCSIPPWLTTVHT